jgi:hypothetical protein
MLFPANSPPAHRLAAGRTPLEAACKTLLQLQESFVGCGDGESRRAPATTAAQNWSLRTWRPSLPRQVCWDDAEFVPVPVVKTRP